MTFPSQKTAPYTQIAQAERTHKLLRDEVLKPWIWWCRYLEPPKKQSNPISCWDWIHFIYNVAVFFWWNPGLFFLENHQRKKSLKHGTAQDRHALLLISFSPAGWVSPAEEKEGHSHCFSGEGRMEKRAYCYISIYVRAFKTIVCYFQMLFVLSGRWYYVDTVFLRV